MPFVPVTPDDYKAVEIICRDPQHNPPQHIVIMEVMKWRCPSCGEETILRPTAATLTCESLPRRN